ncbi:hypothetical protein ACFCV9_40940 [Streptomyces sp. NPDC056367]|uniref:hypothetical protein n=1 Tax=Streptomyces sp. NPDC056367 TaxID=3345797 RepID=UPI0035E0099D
MSDTLFRALDLIEPGDLVLYHGSITDRHGLYLAIPCDCIPCVRDNHRGSNDVRYRLTDPFEEEPDAPTLRCARRESLTRSTANA